jgi:hypothetical protein
VEHGPVQCSADFYYGLLPFPIDCALGRWFVHPRLIAKTALHDGLRLFSMDYALYEGFAALADGYNVLLRGISPQTDGFDPRPRDYAPCLVPSLCDASTPHRPQEAVAASLVLRRGHG